MDSTLRLAMTIILSVTPYRRSRLVELQFPMCTA